MYKNFIDDDHYVLQICDDDPQSMLGKSVNFVDENTIAVANNTQVFVSYTIFVDIKFDSGNVLDWNLIWQSVNTSEEYYINFAGKCIALVRQTTFSAL